MTRAPHLKPLLAAHGIRLTKRLGQHYLTDARVIRAIVDRCAPAPEDTVLEIGAGLGALTEPLARRAGRLVAVEVDPRAAAALAARLADRPRVRVVRQDILRFDWRGVGEALVVGAIPYHITSPILVWLCDHRRHIPRCILVVQAEVAERLAAAPGCKAYGRLTLLVQYTWVPRLLFRVPRSAFFPTPRVDSCCVELVRRDRPPADVSDEARFFGVVRAAFAHRRKTLANSLAGEARLGLTREGSSRLLEGLGVPPSIRAEQLSFAQFASLANALSTQTVAK